MTPLELKNIRVAVVAAEIIGYCLQNIEGKQLFKQRLNTVKNSVKSLENYFSHNLQSEFNKNEYLMFKELLSECIDFDDDTLEIIIESIKNNITTLN